MGWLWEGLQVWCFKGCELSWLIFYFLVNFQTNLLSLICFYSHSFCFVCGGLGATFRWHLKQSPNPTGFLGVGSSDFTQVLFEWDWGTWKLLEFSLWFVCYGKINVSQEQALWGRCFLWESLGLWVHPGWRWNWCHNGWTLKLENLCWSSSGSWGWQQRDTSVVVLCPDWWSQASIQPAESWLNKQKNRELW